MQSNYRLLVPNETAIARTLRKAAFENVHLAHKKTQPSGWVYFINPFPSKENGASDVPQNYSI